MTSLLSESLERGCPPVWATAWGQDAFGPWCIFSVGDVEQRLRWIPPGRFWMGSPEDEDGRFDNEGPRHEVELTQGFWLFDTPCTQALWEAVMGSNPSHFRGPDKPIETVSWNDCQEFVNRIGEHVPGLILDLPTEAQWEYACRAGTPGARYGDDLDAIAWYGENSKGETHPVGRKLPNSWGLYDMLGNVYEWCNNGIRVYKREYIKDPKYSENSAGRVLRGGFWYGRARDARAAGRYAGGPGGRSRDVGFRCSSSG